jgi:hypothetical protein
MGSALAEADARAIAVSDPDDMGDAVDTGNADTCAALEDDAGAGDASTARPHADAPTAAGTATTSAASIAAATSLAPLRAPSHLLEPSRAAIRGVLAHHAIAGEFPPAPAHVSPLP